MEEEEREGDILEDRRQKRSARRDGCGGRKAGSVEKDGRTSEEHWAEIKSERRGRVAEINFAYPQFVDSRSCFPSCPFLRL